MKHVCILCLRKHSVHFCFAMTRPTICIVLLFCSIIQTILAEVKHNQIIRLQKQKINLCKIVGFQTNEITVERFYAVPIKLTVANSIYCRVKYISRRNLNVDIRWNYTKPVYDQWFHIVIYYKFNGITYSKFPIDLWENMCDWLIGVGPKKYALDWALKRILNYTHFNHPCPYYVGPAFVKVDNVSIDMFSFDHLLPSGRYYMDMYLTTGDRVPFIAFKFYFSISDIRVDVFQSNLFFFIFMVNGFYDFMVFVIK